MERESEASNLTRRKGRIVAAAAAAAAAASIGYAKIAQEHDVQATLETQDELGIMFDVLISKAPQKDQENGLTIDVITNWDQVQDILDSGFVTESTFTEIFMSCTHESGSGLVISKSNFPKFAKKLDEESDIGMELVNCRASSISYDETYMQSRNSSVGGSNAMLSQGRMTKAAAAAAVLRQENQLHLGSDNDDQDNMSILYSVLMEEADDDTQLFGLTLEMIFDWGEVQEMMKSGIATKEQISKLFKKNSEDSVVGRVLSKDNFAKFAQMLDEEFDTYENNEVRDSVAEMRLTSCSLRDSNVGGSNQMVSTTKIELSSPQAQHAKGIAAMIRGSPQAKGRMVAAAAAASAAAAIGAAAASRALGDNSKSTLVFSSDMDALFSVLMAANHSTNGLSFEMILQWDEIQKILEAGIMDELGVSAVFDAHASGDALLKQDSFAEFAEHLDDVTSGDDSNCFSTKELPQPPQLRTSIDRNNQNDKLREKRTDSLFSSLADLEALSAKFKPPTVVDTSLKDPSPPPSIPKRLSLKTSSSSSSNDTSPTSKSPTTRSSLRSSKNMSPQRTRSPQRMSSRAKSPVRGNSPMRGKSPVRGKSPMKTDLSPQDAAIQAKLEAHKLLEKQEAEAKLEADRIARRAAAEERMAKRGASPMRVCKSPMRGTGGGQSPTAGKSPTRERGRSPSSRGKSPLRTGKSGVKSPSSTKSPGRDRSEEIESAAVLAEKAAEKEKLDADREARRQAALARMESRKAASPVRGKSPTRSLSKK